MLPAMDGDLKLQAFIYILLRDHLAFGAMENILHYQLEKAEREVKGLDPQMIEYVKSLTAKLRK